MAYALEIVCKSGVFRRAGREFSTTPTTVPLEALSKEQIQALKDEPRLIVREVDVKPHVKPEDSQKSGGGKKDA